MINDDLREKLFGNGLVGKMAASVINKAAGGLKAGLAIIVYLCSPRRPPRGVPVLATSSTR